MADTTTTNVSLTKPEVGASSDTWGTKLNANFDTLDSLFTTGPALLVSKGGTGATTASGARTNLGLAAIASTGSASDLSTGTVAVARLASSGTASSSTYLRGDGSWQTPPTNAGTVTSVATGNGLQGGTITSSGTLSIAAPAAFSVGSYAVGLTNLSGSVASTGSSYSTIYTFNGQTGAGQTARGGTWLALGVTGGLVTTGCFTNQPFLFVRTA